MNAHAAYIVRREKQQRIGAALAQSLVPIRKQRDVAKSLGITPTAVQFFERQALFKVAARMLWVTGGI